MDKNEIKAFIAKRAAQEMHDGDVVNLDFCPYLSYHSPTEE